MKKLLSILAILLGIGLIAPSCSQDENFDEIIENADLDQTAGTGQTEDITERPGQD